MIATSIMVYLTQLAKCMVSEVCFSGMALCIKVCLTKAPGKVLASLLT